MSRGLLIAGHGSHLNPDSSEPAHAHAARIRELGIFDEVHTAFWREEPSLSRGLDAFDADDVVVVPLFVSSGYFTNEVIPQEMGLAGRVTNVRGTTVRLTDPVGSHPSLARVLAQRACEAGATSHSTVAILGHGTERNRDSKANVFKQAAGVQSLGTFADVITVFIDQQPALSDLMDLTSAEDIVVVPLFIADGWHAGQTIPGDLSGLRAGGRCLRYARAAGTHPMVANVILELAREAYA